MDLFDARLGTDTSGIREIGSLDITSDSAPYAVRYQPSSEQTVRTLIQQLEIEPARCSFIDFGSGKGRVLLVAAELPFKEILGIEFSRELHEIALRNIARLRSKVDPNRRVRAICGDAVAFELPANDLVCYFYNPFGPPVMSRVVERLVSHHERSGCRVIVIYVDPRHRDIFEQTGKFTVIKEDPQAIILTTSERSDLPVGTD